MEILAPVDNLDEINILHKSGASEFYCGFIPAKWINRYNSSTIRYDLSPISINQRQKLSCNIKSYKSLKMMNDKAKSLNVPLYLAINKAYYTEDCYDILNELITKSIEIGVSGFIVADLGLITFLNTIVPADFKRILSCVVPIRNKSAVALVKGLNINRITFPRHMSINEINEITNEYPDIEYEIFILGANKCIYENAFCQVFKVPGRFCTSIKKSTYFYNHDYSLVNNDKYKENEQIFANWSLPYDSKNNLISGWSNTECSLCSIPFLINNTNVSTLKIEGRGAGIFLKVKQIRLVKQMIELSYKRGTKEQIRKQIQETFPNADDCRNRLRCNILPD